MKRKYEIMYILDQDLKEPKEVIEKLNAILTSEGTIIETKEWGLKDFAYQINHKKKGYYVVTIVETTNEAIEEFKRISKIDKNVVRFLVLNTENIQNYEQSTELSKTDMTKFEEERRENKKPNFKKNFSRNFEKKEFVKEVKEEVKDTSKEETSTPETSKAPETKTE